MIKEIIDEIKTQLQTITDFYFVDEIRGNLEVDVINTLIIPIDKYFCYFNYDGRDVEYSGNEEIHEIRFNVYVGYAGFDNLSVLSNIKDMLETVETKLKDYVSANYNLEPFSLLSEDIFYNDNKYIIFEQKYLTRKF